MVPVELPSICMLAPITVSPFSSVTVPVILLSFSFTGVFNSAFLVITIEFSEVVLCLRPFAGSTALRTSSIVALSILSVMSGLLSRILFRYENLLSLCFSIIAKNCSRFTFFTSIDISLFCANMLIELPIIKMKSINKNFSLCCFIIL